MKVPVFLFVVFVGEKRARVKSVPENTGLNRQIKSF